MRGLVCAALVIATVLAASGCASSHAARYQSSTDAVQFNEVGYEQLPPKLRDFIRTTIRDSLDGRATEIDVYGPASRAALVKASSGDVVVETAGQRDKPFYLIVLHGHFVCGECSRPLGAKSPEGTIETHVWSPTAGTLDFGVQSSLPATVSLLDRVAMIQVS